MDNFKYLKYIDLMTRNSKLMLTSDRGDEIFVNPIDEISFTRYCDIYVKTSMRKHQVEQAQLVAQANTYLNYQNTYTLSSPRKSSGSSDHDVFYMHMPQEGCHFLLTAKHTWIQSGDMPVRFHVLDSEPGIDTQAGRDFVWQFREACRCALHQRARVL